MKSKNTFYIIFWLAGCLFVLGYLCITRMISLEPKYIICFSTSAFCVSVASFLSQITEEFNLKYFFKMLLDFLVYIFMGFSMFSLVVFPFIIKSINYIPLSNCLTLWSLALIFMATVVKEIKYNLASRKKSDKPNSELEQNPTGRELKIGAQAQ